MTLTDYLKRCSWLFFPIIFSLSALLGSAISDQKSSALRPIISMLSMMAWMGFSLISLVLSFREEEYPARRLDFDVWLVNMLIGIAMTLLSFLAFIHSF